MEVTLRSLVTEMHGMLFGAFFLMTIFGVVVELCRSALSMQPSELTDRGYCVERVYLITMVVLGWAAVLSGSYIVYPWYRTVMPAGAVDLANYPKYLLLSSPTTAGWHNMGMEWKEYIAWIAPMAMTMVAYVLIKYKSSLKEHLQVRKAVFTFAVAAFVAVGIAGLFGAMIDKEAPVRGGAVIHITGQNR